MVCNTDGQIGGFAGRAENLSMSLPAPGEVYGGSCHNQASGATVAHARSAAKMQLEAELRKVKIHRNPTDTVCYHIWPQRPTG